MKGNRRRHHGRRPRTAISHSQAHDVMPLIAALTAANRAVDRLVGFAATKGQEIARRGTPPRRAIG